MKALIIDDEEQIRTGLKLQLEKYCSEITIIKEAKSVSTGLMAIAKYQPDIVFLDVELGDGSGLDLLKQLGNYGFQLVFTTAHNKYAIDAFKFSAIDFLLKPVDPDDLVASLKKAVSQSRNKDLRAQIQVLHESLNTISQEHKKMVLRDKDSIYFVKVNDIIRCHAKGPYTEFFINTGKQITISRNLKEYEELLAPYGFIRTHHSHLINVKRIIRFDRVDGGNLIMENDDEIPVSQRKKENLMDMIAHL